MEYVEQHLNIGHLKNIRSKMMMVAVDLSGICDSDEKDTQKFNDITKSQIKNATFVFFVSDVHKAFITDYHGIHYYKSLE